MTSKYDHLTKEQLIGILKARDSNRKLGLVWEKNEIEADNTLNDDFITMTHLPELSIGGSPYDNLLIEADNFDALRYLNITHKSKIKCIYIDPPYNTGKKDFIYNDSFVEEDDAWKHSKWLEFMYKRLNLAKELLRNDGVIFVSIGEEEYAHLKLLMDEIFPNMKVGTFVWRRRSGSNDEKEWFLSSDHEYVLCYANKDFSFSGVEKDWSKAQDDGDERGKWVDGPLNQGKDIKQRPDAYYPIYNPETSIWYPCDPDSVWRFASQERAVEGQKIRTKFMEQLVEEKRISWPSNEEIVFFENMEQLDKAMKEGNIPHNLRIYERLQAYKEDFENGRIKEKVLMNIPPLEFWVGKRIGLGKPRIKRFISEIKKTEKPVSTWIMPSSIKKKDLELLDLEEVEAFKVGTNTEGTTLLSKMIGNKDFSYPKPLSLIKTLIQQSTDSESEHIILDFFAGSGTLGQAVLELNNEDGGDRKFILVSSTEATKKHPTKNVCKEITYKRLDAAINGYSWKDAKGNHEVEGTEGNFAYLKCERISYANLHLDIKHEQIWYCLQQLHFNFLDSYQTMDKYQVSKGENLNIYYIPEISKEIILCVEADVLNDKKQAVIYCWQPGILKQKIKNENVLVEGIPEKLVELFRR
ncbi:TPA: site-specific DNA-methyltransferase [Bacillus cereus]|nr:site-specific DNA-methyltransferase [Bacillus cereus]HDR4542724.1 site-specific DNA-methyltransferase [Bacillus cereus]HDR4843762.1 site-specific DNA-methyltransferase [Bacillus cereus]HDR4890149.1 site-specific DNA-methyltransferase [Bacillus cereus]HDR8081461.1 site-specific DNA-methyltransferase [Bacillus cereus]